MLPEETIFPRPLFCTTLCPQDIISTYPTTSSVVSRKQISNTPNFSKFPKISITSRIAPILPPPPDSSYWDNPIDFGSGLDWVGLRTAHKSCNHIIKSYYGEKEKNSKKISFQGNFTEISILGLYRWMVVMM